MTSNQKSMDSQLHIPKASVRRIMKLNDEVTIISAVSTIYNLIQCLYELIINLSINLSILLSLYFFQDAIVATAKASELFIADFLDAARKEAVTNGRKTIKVCCDDV